MAIAEVNARSFPATVLPTADDAAVHLRPSHGPVWGRTVRNVAVMVLPVSATEVYLSPGMRSLAIASITAMWLILLAVLAGWRLSRASVTLKADGVCERVIVPPDHHTPMGVIVRAVSVRIRQSGSVAAPAQVFFQDEAGRTRLRMRAAYWGDQQIALVARHLGVQISDAGEPVGIPELRQSGFVRLYWFETHPFLTNLAIVIVGAAFAAGIALNV